MKIGKTIHVAGTLNISSAASGVITVTLPVQAASQSVSYTGSAWAIDVGSAYYTGTILVPAGSTFLNFTTNGNQNQWDGTRPHTWASGDQIHFSVTYEAA